MEPRNHAADRPHSRLRHSRTSRGRSRPDGTVAVEHGDTLGGLARALQVHGGRPALYAADQDALGDGPDLVLAGQTLHLP